MCENTLWWSTPSHAMIISAYDYYEKDFLCAGHSNERQALPLLEAIENYDSVRILCF
ncbi:MAG: hypothetical protein IJC98_08645 [Clostridia bacterium]|nr:hypothetical protein [Clostridia bacterium]